MSSSWLNVSTPLTLFIFNFVILVYQEGQWKAEKILSEIHQCKLLTRLLESRQWLQTTAVELTSLKSQLEQTSGSSEKQINKLQKVRSSWIHNTQRGDKIIPQKGHSEIKDIQHSKMKLDIWETDISLTSNEIQKKLVSEEKKLVEKET